MLSTSSVTHLYKHFTYAVWYCRNSDIERRRLMTNTFSRLSQQSFITSSSRMPPWLQLHFINHQRCLHSAVPARISRGTGIKHFTNNTGRLPHLVTVKLHKTSHDRIKKFYAKGWSLLSAQNCRRGATSPPERAHICKRDEFGETPHGQKPSNLPCVAWSCCSALQ